MRIVLRWERLVSVRSRRKTMIAATPTMNRTTSTIASVVKAKSQNEMGNPRPDPLPEPSGLPRATIATTARRTVTARASGMRRRRITSGVSQ